MRGNPMQRNFGIGSPAKQTAPPKPDQEGEKKVMDKRTKTVKDHQKNAPKPTTQEQADQLNQMDADNIAAYNTSRDSIQGVYDKYNAYADSTNTANAAKTAAEQKAFDEYMKSKSKPKSPAKQGLRDPKKDYTDPKVLQEEKKGNQRIHDIRTGEYDKDKKRKKAIKKGMLDPVRPPKKKSPAKQKTDSRPDFGPTVDVRKKKNATKIAENKRQEKYDGPRSKGGLLPLTQEDLRKRKSIRYETPAKQTTSDKIKRPHLYDGKPKNGKPSSYNGPRSKGGLLPKKKGIKKSPAKCPLVALAGPIMGAVGGAMKKDK